MDRWVVKRVSRYIPPHFNVKYLVMNIVAVDRNRQNNIGNKL